MVVKTLGVSVDVGGSGPRSKTDKKSVTEHSNRFKKVIEEGFRVKETEEPKELFKIVKSPMPSYKGIYAVGTSGDLYKGSYDEITTQATKTESDSYYLQLIYCLAVECLNDKLKNLEENLSNKIVLSSTINDLIITTCIPVREHAGDTNSEAILKEKLAGEYEVEFPGVAEGITVLFKIEDKNIFVIPEGAMAVTTVSQIKKDDVTLVLDMGFVTFDIAFFKGKQLQGEFTDSPPVAGSKLISLVRNALMDAGHRVTFDGAKDALETGKLQKGGGYIEIGPVIKAVKEIFVNNHVRPALHSLLSVADYGLQDITNVLPIGGPMTPSEDCGDLVDMIIDICGLENSTILLQEGNLRHVNIDKAFGVLQFIMKKKNMIPA